MVSGYPGFKEKTGQSSKRLERLVIFCFVDAGNKMLKKLFIEFFGRHKQWNVPECCVTLFIVNVFSLFVDLKNF